MKLREMRLKLDMTQAQLAEALDVPQATISRWERGPETDDGTNIAQPTILRLALEHLRCKRKK
jgi:DNA-binding XRE family transcriptional regulator